MRIFSYWSRIERNVPIEGVSRQLHCYGGSNRSMEDAARDAQQRLDRVLKRIQGTRIPDPDYEADIREEITAKIDPRNIVTRNRYGAEVLNSTAVMFVDIDEPRCHWWEVLFGRSKDVAQRKARIVAFVRKWAAAPEVRDLGLRLYETHKGIRAIITGRKFDPQAPATRQILRRLNADYLYTLLCAKQGCFRARLTPKPHRMKYPAPRMNFPRVDAAAEQTFQAWLAEYQRKRKTFATCRFLCTIGPEQRNPVVDYHDRATGAFTDLKLA